MPSSRPQMATIAGALAARQFEILLRVADAGQQQFDRGSRRDLPQLVRIGGSPNGGQSQRRHAQHAFTHETQLLLGGRQNLELLGAAQYCDDQRADISRQSVTVVEQQQGVPIREALRDPLEQFLLAGACDRQRQRERLQPLVGAPSRGQIKEPDAVREPVRAKRARKPMRTASCPCRRRPGSSASGRPPAGD